ncbi:MAG: hypothetical protein MZV49_15685 [Rhodopseudomonas palustris]|nr:hypothetical protein [Rhodopseudomonas palustris]
MTVRAATARRPRSATAPWSIAAITSPAPTRPTRPSCWRAGLLARKAVARGLTVPP